MTTETSEKKQQPQAFVRLRSTNGEWFVHKSLRRKLVADAKRHQTNLTEVALSILAERYGIEYVPTGRRTTPRTGNVEFLNFGVPEELARAIKDAARRSSIELNDDVSWIDQIRNDLQDHYDLI